MTHTSLTDYKKNFVPSDPKLAPEQELFAKYPGPYSILSAGAGSGKTYTIQAKIDWLINTAGMDLKDILALSFTRTAANNLAARYPGVKSMTFDAFSADIFSQAFPAGKDLIIADDIAVYNSFVQIEKYNGFSNIPKNIVDEILTTIRKVTPQSRFKTLDVNTTIGLLTLIINTYPDEFKNMLIKAGVVSFNIRKAFTTANALSQLPAKYQPIKYLVIDEAQDSTQPETVMVLTLAAYNNWRVSIVGDASQNISEWRGVSPDAFMESQHLGGFANFTLQSNYRSEYPILHTANQLLKYAETNEVAQIQLQSPVPVMPLLDEYKKRVHFYQTSGTPIQFNEKGSFDDHYPFSPLSIKDMVEIVNQARQKKESVAVLARTNQQVDLIAHDMNALGADMFTKPLTKRASTYRSETLEKILQHTHSISEIISQTTNKVVVKTVMNQVLHNHAYQGMVDEFVKDMKSILVNPSIIKYINANNFNTTVLSINYLMIRLEAKDNAQRQQLDTSDDTNQLANQDYVVATYHASKGLEWDHVIIIDSTLDSMNKRKKNQQEELRLAYVAITRAKKQLYILSLIDDQASMMTGANVTNPSIFTNTKSAVINNPFAHAYVLGLSETIDVNGHKADLTNEMPDITFIKTN